MTPNPVIDPKIHRGEQKGLPGSYHGRESRKVDNTVGKFLLSSIDNPKDNDEGEHTENVVSQREIRMDFQDEFHNGWDQDENEREWADKRPTAGREKGER